MNRHRPFAAALLCAAAILLAALPAHATQSPPPQQYTLTVNRSGGSDCTKVRIYSPTTTDWTSTSVTRSFVVGTTIEVEYHVVCPCGYKFVEWESNDSQLDGQPPFPFQAEFQINQNTTATAKFQPTEGELVVYVIDPTPNSSRVHPEGVIDSGHAFWRINYLDNCAGDDLNTYANTAWGFYPNGPTYEESSLKKYWVTVAGILKNDNHKLSQVTNQRTYPITWSGVVAALEYTKALHVSPFDYHTNEFNCTDALMGVAYAAGVSLPSAAGSCSHFSGNCPGVLGENL